MNGQNPSLHNNFISATYLIRTLPDQYQLSDD